MTPAAWAEGDAPLWQRAGGVGVDVAHVAGLAQARAEG